MARKWLPPALLLLALALLWEAGVRLLDVKPYIIPAPSRVLQALWEQRAVWPGHIWTTLAEALLGLALSVVFGAASAVWIHFSRIARAAVYPLLVASQTIPIIVLSPIFIAWFGYEIWGKVAVAVLFAFFPIAVNTIDGLRQTDPDALELLRSMGASRSQQFWKLQVPSALPGFFTGFKMAATISVVGASVGEWLGAESGLGMFGRRASNMMKIDLLFASVIILALLGIALFAGAALLERRLTPWRFNRDK
ncbi:ABC transporter permease [Paenibacillus thermoaerophilus]|uniref:ABC transporter permease n=1 Tax=Paenibacillus thermoaerophilus TaxID=1215385 RepID=A0ABW2V2P9_9BACL|nr:ABC transporter permease [Paenibacillus thermoaerophilus]TMV17727.1 ABC transporter permease [Paenibacillus thermoaerophilus]